MLDHPVIVELSRNLALVLSVGVLATLALLLRMSARRRKSGESAAVISKVGAPAPAPGAANARASLKDLAKRLKTADNASLAALYLQIAAAHRELGDEPARMTALRSAAGLGALHGPRADHARARLELAELAFDAGDMIGACEQWQMARTALLEDGQMEEHARIDKRMRDQGCPTDWVLTDF